MTTVDEARRRRGWLDAAEIVAAADDAARRRMLDGVRAVLATKGDEATAAAVRLAQEEGVPCVVVDRDKVGGLVRHGSTGYVSASADESHLRAAVAKLLRDDVLWSRMRAALRPKA